MIDQTIIRAVTNINESDMPQLNLTSLRSFQLVLYPPFILVYLILLNSTHMNIYPLVNLKRYF